MLAEDASFTMPPLATWWLGRDSIATWARNSSMSGDWIWKAVHTRANGQVALGFYALDRDSGDYLPFALNLLTFRGREIADVTAFINRSIEAEDQEAYIRFPEQAADPRRLEATFGRFGLPDKLD
jgi:RNA polymerase sigma-70 factor (ECF subfamily)